MFTLGNVRIGDYRVWITTPVFTVDPQSVEAQNLPYYEVLVSKRMEGWPPGYYSYVNPIKDIFKWEMTDRNPLAKPKDKENMTPDEVEFKAEQSSYNDRKEMGMPLTKFSRKHVEELLQRLCQEFVEFPSGHPEKDIVGILSACKSYQILSGGPGKDGQWQVEVLYLDDDWIYRRLSAKELHDWSKRGSRE